MGTKMARRDFLGGTIAAGVGAAVLGRQEALAQAAKPKAVVVKAVRDNAVVDSKPDPKVVREMVHAVVMKLSGKSSPADAWKCYVKPDDVVAVKINCLFGRGASTHPYVTSAVVEGIRMAGVPAEKIIVWDRGSKDLQKAGYQVGKIDGVTYTAVDGDWEEEPTRFHTCEGRFAKILTRRCTALINVPILKTHVRSGITFAMKNHYGSFHNAGNAHAGRGKPAVHGGTCDPFIAELTALDVIRKKERLIVGDALLPVANKGPMVQPQFTYAEKAIMAAVNPVAIDYVGLKMLDAQRKKMGLEGLEESGSAKCVFTAAEKGLGPADMSKIELVTA